MASTTRGSGLPGLKSPKSRTAKNNVPTGGRFDTACRRWMGISANHAARIAGLGLLMGAPHKSARGRHGRVLTVAPCAVQVR